MRNFEFKDQEGKVVSLNEREQAYCKSLDAKFNESI